MCRMVENQWFKTEKTKKKGHERAGFVLYKERVNLLEYA